MRVDCVFCKADTIEGGGDSLLALSRRHSGELRVVVQQFRRSKIVVEIWLFGKKSDLRPNRGILDSPTKNCRGSGRGLYEPHQKPKGRGFASTIRAEIAEDLTFANFERQRQKCTLGVLSPEPGGYVFSSADVCITIKAIDWSYWNFEEIIK